MLNKLFCVVVTMSVAIAVYSQHGSPYTRYGLGNLSSQNFGPAKAMGGISSAFHSGRNLNIANPAAMASIDSLTFIFEFGMESGLRHFRTTSPSLQALNGDTKLSYLAFGFPVTRWWASSLGVMPYSEMGYNIRSTDTLYNVPKYYFYEGSGGINQVFWSHGFAPFKNFRIGINMYYLFGLQNRSNSIKFNDDSGAYVNVMEQNIVYINDFCFSTGLQYDVLTHENNSLSLGFTFSYPTQLNSRRDALVTNSLSVGSSAIVDTIYNNSGETGSVSLPMSIGGGFIYTRNDKMRLGFDYSMQDWSKSTFFNQSDSLGNSNCMRLGIEYTPAGLHRPAAKYGQKVSYRFGVFYNNTYINFLSTGEQISDFGISFGFGLPMNRSKTSFNISIELGQRGTTQSSLVRERYANIGLNLTLSDVWFVKRKID